MVIQERSATSQRAGRQWVDVVRHDIGRVIVRFMNMKVVEIKDEFIVIEAYYVTTKCE